MLNLTRPHLPAPRAPDSCEQRTARNLTACQELIDLGMMLARAAAERAVSDIHTAPPLAPPLYSMARQVEHAEARARANEPDYCQAFAHISRSIRQTILLETRLAEGRATQAPRNTDAQAAQNTAGTPQTEPDRPPLHTSRERLYEEADEVFEDEHGPAPLDHATAQRIIRDIADTYKNVPPVLAFTTPTRPKSPNTPPLGRAAKTAAPRPTLVATTKRPADAKPPIRHRE